MGEKAKRYVIASLVWLNTENEFLAKKETKMCCFKKLPPKNLENLF